MQLATCVSKEINEWFRRRRLVDARNELFDYQLDHVFVVFLCWSNNNSLSQSNWMGQYVIKPDQSSALSGFVRAPKNTLVLLLHIYGRNGCLIAFAQYKLSSQFFQILHMHLSGPFLAHENFILLLLEYWLVGKL